eukprot:gene7420-13179_t
MPDGTRREVEEEVEEPVDTPAGDDYLVIDRETEKVTRRVEELKKNGNGARKKAKKRANAKPDSGLKEEPEEPISRMVVVKRVSTDGNSRRT